MFSKTPGIVLNENFKSIYLKDILDAYFDCRKNKRNNHNAVLFEYDYILNVYQLWEEIIDNKYEIGKSIAFIIKIPRIREVFAALFRDRIVHHLIYNKFNPIIDKSFIKNSFSCRPNKGTIHAIKSFYNGMQIITNNYTEDAWIFKCDIKAFLCL